MNEDQIIKDAQFRKSLSISFFNATNNATQIVEMIYKDHPQSDEIVIQKDISKWRDWLLETHKKYYSEVIANAGKNYDAQKTIQRLKDTKSLEELKSVWVGLSEDERRDGDIIKETNKLKKTYEKD